MTWIIPLKSSISSRSHHRVVASTVGDGLGSGGAELAQHEGRCCGFPPAQLLLTVTAKGGAKANNINSCEETQPWQYPVEQAGEAVMEGADHFLRDLIPHA